MDTNQFKFLIYRTAEREVSVNAIIKDETIWLTQKAMAELSALMSLRYLSTLQTFMKKVNCPKIQGSGRGVYRDIVKEG